MLLFWGWTNKGVSCPKKETDTGRLKAAKSSDVKNQMMTFAPLTLWVASKHPGYLAML